MLPTFADDKAAYEFSQTIEMTTRETAQTPPKKMHAVQQGFVFVESLLQGKPPMRVSRFFTQHLLSLPTMARLRTLKMAPRKELAEEHLRLYFSTPRPFGLELPFELTTDLLGGGATPAADPGRTGRPKPAIPFDILHWPMVTPALSADDPAVGKSWKALIAVRCGFGNFTLPYSAKCIARDLAQVTAEATFDPPPPDQEKPAILNGIHLVFHPSGTWTVVYNLMDGSPASAKGELHYHVIATVPTEGTSTEVINAKLSFQWKRIPMGFTPQFLMTEAWTKLS